MSLCYKKGFYSIEHALIQAKSLLGTGKVKTIGIYPCDYCDKYHFSKNELLHQYTFREVRKLLEVRTGYTDCKCLLSDSLKKQLRRESSDKNIVE